MEREEQMRVRHSELVAQLAATKDEEERHELKEMIRSFVLREGNSFVQLPRYEKTLEHPPEELMTQDPLYARAVELRREYEQELERVMQHKIRRTELNERVVRRLKDLGSDLGLKCSWGRYYTKNKRDASPERKK